MMSIEVEAFLGFQCLASCFRLSGCKTRTVGFSGSKVANRGSPCSQAEGTLHSGNPNFTIVSLLLLYRGSRFRTNQLRPTTSCWVLQQCLSTPRVRIRWAC